MSATKHHRRQPSTGPPAEHQPLVVVLLAACAGIVADRYWGFALLTWSIAGAGGLLAWWVLWRRDRMQWAALPLLCAVTAVAGGWHHCRWSLFDTDEVSLLAADDGGPAAVEARLIGGPRRIPAPPYDPLYLFATPERTRLEIEVLAVRDDTRWRASSGRTTLFVNGVVEGLRAGDRVRVFGQLAPTRAPANPGEYDFAARARVDRRLCWLSAEFPECVSAVARDGGWSWQRMLSYLRDQGDALLWRNLRGNRSALAAAMFLGSREELQPEETQAFLETGTIHLLVISGLNVGILAVCLLFVFRVALVPRHWALAAVVAASILYAAATDAQPPVVRATVMVLVACTAATLGRRALAYNSIAAAGLIVLALNPEELFQSGTQLSFLCVAALAWLAQKRYWRRELDPLDRLIARTRPVPIRAMRQFGASVVQLTVASAVIWLVVCPLVMARFHLVSPIAIALGPILSVPVAIAMAAGFGIFAIGWLAPPVAAAMGYVCEANLAFMQTSVEWGRAAPGNHFWVAGPSDWWLAVFYGMLAIWLLAPRFAPPARWCAGIVAGWIALGLVVPLVAPRDDQRLAATFLSVGHGVAVVLELPGGQTLLYDAGRLGAPTGASRAVAGYLWSRGITHLDAVVISHADADHYNGVPALLDQFSVGVVYVSPVMFEQRSAALDALRDAIHTAGVPMREVWAGDRLRATGEASIEVLHPPRRGVLGSDNANSIVLDVEYAGRRLLLTGDLETPGLEDVVAELPLDCDVLLAPHHGSAASDPPGFAAWSTPEWTIVSSGRGEMAPAVTHAYSARGGRVFSTAERGAVRVEISRGDLEVECWHGEDR